MELSQAWLELGWWHVSGGVFVGALVTCLWAAMRLKAANGNWEQEREKLHAELLALQGAFDNQGGQLTEKSETVIRLESEVNHLQGKLDDLNQHLKAAQADVGGHRAELEHRAREISEVKADLKSEQARAAGLVESRDDYRNWWEKAKSDLSAESASFSRLRTEHQELKTTLQQKEEHFAEQLALLKESREQLKKEFEVVANDILDKKGKAFSELSEKNITGLLQPIQTEMKDFRVKIETLHLEDTKQHASLKTELKNLQDLNREITDQAQHLTEALRGQKKLQGNWGELILERVLEGSGLRQGTDYRLEQSFNTEEGRRRPDAVVYLPQNKHLIIDAKTSLESYIQYVNSEDDDYRVRAQAAHARAVSDRIKELSNKNYYDLPGLNSPEVVVMFIPVESAYVEALRYDDTIFQRAIDNNVLVATPTTLLTSLNIVRQLWRFQDQSKHSAELASRAEKFHTKLTLFLESMLDVEKKLDSARTSYDKAMGQLVNGRGNLIKQASEFSELGVAVKKELPEQFVDRARLELDLVDESSASFSGETKEGVGKVVEKS